MLQLRNLSINISERDDNIFFLLQNRPRENALDLHEQTGQPEVSTEPILYPS